MSTVVVISPPSGDGCGREGIASGRNQEDGNSQGKGCRQEDIAGQFHRNSLLDVNRGNMP